MTVDSQVRSNFRRLSLRRWMVGVGCAVVATLSCGREPTGPGGGQPIAGLAWQAKFPDGFAALQAVGSGGVLFSKVRVVLRLPEGGVALDTLVDFPSTATDLQLTLSVSLPASAPTSGQPLELTLDYRNDAGVTVFTGGPVTVTAIPVRRGSKPPPPSPVTISLVYVGPGASAASVEITPLVTSAGMGDSIVFTAQAKDGAGVVIPNTPVVFSVTDTTFASINAVSGHGKAANKRGATTVTATLLTGPSATAALTVTPVPAVITKVSGDAQNAVVTAVLGAPLVVRVDAPDGLPMQGATVTFAINKGGGAVTASATTDANGLASAAWTLGDTAGVQGVTASAGAAVTANFTATAASGIAKSIVAVSGSAQSGAVSAALAQPFVVKAADQFGNPVNGVNITWTVLSGGGSLTSATTTTDALGLAQNTLTLGALAGTNSVTAANLAVDSIPVTFTATGAAGALTAFAVTAPPLPATAGVALAPAITVTARDAGGNTVSSFAGSVTLALASNPGGATLGGTTSVTAVAGVATFANVRVVKSGTGYSLTATSGGTTGTSATFDVAAAAAFAIAVDSGDGQSAIIATVLPVALVGKVVDSLGNAVPGANVTWTIATGGGLLNGQTTTTDANGRVRATWTLGLLAAGQTVALATTPTPVAGSPVTFTANGNRALLQWTGAKSTDWADPANWNPPVVPDSTMNVQIPKGTLNAPQISVSGAAVRDLTLDADATMTIVGGRSGFTTIAGNLTIGARGRLDLQGSAFAVLVGGSLATDTAGTTGVTGCEATGTSVFAYGQSNTVTGKFCGLLVSDSSTYAASGPLVVTGDMAAGGTFVPNGNSVSVDSVFAVSGKLDMSNGADSVTVFGTAGFTGTSPSILTKGKLVLHGDFIEAGNNPSFPATSGHTTILAGTSMQTVAFTHPGTGPSNSHFGTLQISNVSDTVSFTSNVFVDGQLVATGGSAHVLAGSGNPPQDTLTSMGANVNNVTFSTLLWRVVDGAAITNMNAVTLTNNCCNLVGSQFTLMRSDDGSTYPTFSNWTFGNLDGGDDMTVTGLGPLLTVTFSTPTYSSGAVTLTNSRLIGWP